ncbi:MAG: spore coat protein U domain-containing protein [Halomonas sp.]|uniref:Csu type fimbrial protein n=1 Tax=Halomonas sp. TaxID=1486246 RepID=UPI0017F7EDE6|nr:spore coat U domain-containing protein [Halomonas sp.]NWN84160.1 spore coat protein U domain-containing protein [Halomonas sp.]
MKLNRKVKIWTSARPALGILIATMLAMPSMASAQTSQDTATFDVTITLENSCELTTAPTDMAFDTVGLLNTDHTATSTVSVTCTDQASYTLALDGGTNADATRRMDDGNTNYVSYDLYSDSGHSTLWGDGTNFGDAVTDTGNGQEQEVIVYGRVEAADNATTPPAGSYSDNVTVEVLL